MKLCRFELHQEPGVARSGIFFEGRLYETDGATPIGVHDLSKVRMLSPVAQPPTARFFTERTGRRSFAYRNPTGIGGPISELEIPAYATELDVEVRLAAVVADRGMQFDIDEAQKAMLGVTIVLALVARNMEPQEREYGEPPWLSVDLPMAMGPFVTTMEELEPLAVEQEPAAKYRWKWSLFVSGKLVDESEGVQDASFAELVAQASQSRELLPGEVIAEPPLPLRPLAVTPLGRSLQPGDQLQATVEGLGTLVVQLA